MIRGEGREEGREGGREGGRRRASTERTIRGHLGGI